MKGMLFDFNGTLFWDTDFHDKAWKKIGNHYLGRDLSDQEFLEHFHGKTNPQIIQYILKNNPKPGIFVQIASEKETLYRDLCSSNPERLKLAPGAENFLEYLKRKGIPCAIATAAGLDNIEFYFTKLDLDRWFSMDKIVYDDGTFPGKPAPDVYLKAADRLGLSPADCAVFEDSLSGVKSAASAGAGMIIAVHSEGSKDIAQLINNPSVNRVIQDFTAINTLFTS